MIRSLAILALLVLVLPIQAKVRTQAVEYKDGDAVLEGFLAYDDASKEKRPGILVVHEWWGLNDYAKKRAETLAEMGYVAFAPDMYGKGKVTSDPKQAKEWATHMRSDAKMWKQRALAGLAILQKHDLVDAKRLAGIGYCFGGTTVLTLALEGTDLKAVVSFHGGLMEPTKEQAQAVKGKLMICHGAADAFIPEDAIRKFRAPLDAAKVDYQFIAYSNAVHSFTVPDADSYKVDGVKYDKNADRRSWAHMKGLFDEVFGARK